MINLNYEDINNFTNNTTMETKEQLNEAFILGFRANKKLTDKIILDSLNKYKSSLANEQIPKLGRTANFEKEVHYKACIEVLLEIQNKLK